LKLLGTKWDPVIMHGGKS